MAQNIEFKFKSPNESPGYLLGQVTMLWQRKHKKVLDPLNLTQTQFVLLTALGWLSKENENVTQVDIANQSNSDRMMVSKVLRTLEEKNFISRQEHQTDTRAKVIKLTDEGAKVLQKALTVIENADIDFFSAIGDKQALFNLTMVNLIEQNRGE
ncbi:MarR family winged helix-turn-helix transcriptional regulator [Pedobacter sp. MW01-1-1]|uniref:MarR family winged helix-turn-helix transcriptional regulator n=1 Tax=Pedobacter sp. MW01-1-1 TaxID=3383027 RepID=UPI003FF0517B